MPTKKKPAKNDGKEKTYRITPKGLFVLSLHDVMPFLMDDDAYNRNLDVVWELFESRMRSHGYLKDYPAESK